MSGRKQVREESSKCTDLPFITWQRNPVHCLELNQCRKDKSLKLTWQRNPCPMFQVESMQEGQTFEAASPPDPPPITTRS